MFFYCNNSNLHTNKSIIMDDSDCLEVGGDDIPYIAKLFCKKDANNWEELYVGICSVSKSVCAFLYFCAIYLILFCSWKENGVL